MEKTTLHRTGLTFFCALLIFLVGMGAVQALAEDGGGGSPAPNIPNLPQPTIDAATYNSNPGSLLADPNALGANVSNLMNTGVQNQPLSNTLASGNVGKINQPDWQTILDGLSGSNATSPESTISLIDGIVRGDITPDLGKALAAAPSLGNVSSPAGMSNLLNMSSITNLLKGMSASQQGFAIDNILKLALNKGALSNLMSGSGLSSLANVIGAAAPQLMAALGGQAGLTNALGNTLGYMNSGAMGAGGLGSNGLGGAATSAGLGGGGGISGDCCGRCKTEIPKHHTKIKEKTTEANTYIKNNITTEFQKHRTWLETTFWTGGTTETGERFGILPALMLMAEQLTATGLLKVEIVGTFLDAKHQLETQRDFQTLTARAHKDYQPSEGMCTFGTAVRSLAGSERRSDLAQTVFADRMTQRQARSGDVLSVESEDSDIRSRAKIFISTYCDQADNANGLTFLCPDAVPTPERRNIDINYTRNIESRLTLDIDFMPTTGADTVTPDEQDVFALSANLFSHNIVPYIQPELFGTKDGRVRLSAAKKYMDLRSIFAKRSVAQNAFAAIAAVRASGAPESAPYTKAIIRELGVADDEEINKLMGENPSYLAQMEILTKKIYESPVFYTALYDTPVNVERKGAALQAIGLMQDRDFYDSLIRSEAVLSVLLETMLQDEQEAVVNAMGDAGGGGS